MKKLFFLSTIVAALLALQACNGGGSGNVSIKAELQTAEDTILYGLGTYTMKTILEQFNIENPDISAINAGMMDALNKQEKISDQEFNGLAQAYLQKKQMQIGEENVTKGQNFLAENAKKEGVQTTASGLQYKVIQEGSGESPSAMDEVTVHYTGRTIDGKVFDSSVERGEPVTFPLAGVIPGWTEGVQLMKPGGKYELYIPSELAYGARGAGQDIGPNETLIFEIELISVHHGDDHDH